MNSKRLQSYYFNCPCCTQPHARLFEYYAKFHGYIDEKDPLENYPDASLYERVVMDEENYAGKTLSLGESTFRCGNCYEFFKFDDYVSEPFKLSPTEAEEAKTKFKPITMYKYDAIKNAFEMLKRLSDNRGYRINDLTGEITIVDGNGREYVFNFGNELIDAFYQGNPNFAVRETNFNKDKTPIDKLLQEKTAI